MIGDTIIHERSVSRVQRLDIDSLNDFAHVDFDRLLMLDLCILLEDSGLSWTSGDPIIFDEDAGLCVIRINPSAIDYVIQHHISGDFSADLTRLKEFTIRYGLNDCFHVSVM